MNRLVSFLLLLVLLTGCAPISPPGGDATSDAGVPNFSHIVVIILENKGFETVIGNPAMPTFNRIAQEYTLLTDYHAIRHPSLPNYLSMIGGDTFGIDSDCTDCFIDAPTLPDLIEASGRTWKTYQEDMPAPCFLGDQGEYYQKHNPFVYFDSIRLNQTRCEQDVVPLTALQKDIESGSLPNFIFITPNICNDAHNCSLETADAWLAAMLTKLVPALDEKATGEPSLLVIAFDEAQKSTLLRRLMEPGGGRVPVVLYSPLVKKGFQDSTFYNHYSLLKTISAAWGLEYLGHAADSGTLVISAPWK